MNSKQFLLWGGLILVVVGMLGFFGILGPTPDKSIFGSSWWFDNGENWAHLVIGVIGLIAAYSFPLTVQKPLVLLLGVVGVLVGLYSLLVSKSFLGSNLENPADTILHLAVGIWALYAGLVKAPAAAAQSSDM